MNVWNVWTFASLKAWAFESLKVWAFEHLTVWKQQTKNNNNNTQQKKQHVCNTPGHENKYWADALRGNSTPSQNKERMRTCFKLSNLSNVQTLNFQTFKRQQVSGRTSFVFRTYKDRNDRIGKIYRSKRWLDPFPLQNR